MKHELRSLAGAAALAVVLGLLHGCAAPTATAPAAPPRQPEPPPIKTQEASPKDRAALHAELGAGYYERGRMDVAIEELTEAQNLDPDNPKIYNYFALVYTVLGENAKAEQNFQRALQLSPNDPEVHHNWGWYLCSNDRPKESIPEFEAALRDPFYKTPEIALTNAGTLQRRLRRLCQRRRLLSPRARSVATNAPALYGLRSSRIASAATTKPARIRDGWHSFRSRRPRRCFSGCASSAKPGTAPPKRCTRAAPQPLSRIGRSEVDRDGRVRMSERSIAGAGEAAGRAGALLRAAREAAGLSVETVAQQLKLAPRQVRALEGDDFERLPGRTFVRGFVRNYGPPCSARRQSRPRSAAHAADTPTLDAPALHATAPTMAELPTADAPKARWTRWAIPASLAAVVAVAAAYEWTRPAVASARTSRGKGSGRATPAPAPASPASPPLPASLRRRRAPRNAS
jgi:type IV pilus biogenesis/stability protein PilW